MTGDTDDIDPHGDGSDTADADAASGDLPTAAVTEAERLTRLARDAVDPAEVAAYERDRRETLADHGYRARLREEDATLVLYPDDWVEDGAVSVERMDDLDRAVEVSLTGAGDDDAWDAVEEANAAAVEDVAADHDDVHAANARAFADFMGNHYARRVEAASPHHVREFLDEYYPRNAWPSTAQREAVERSLSHLFDAVGADVDVPDSST